MRIRDNPMRTKADWRKALSELVEPLKPYYSEGGARLRLGGSGAGHAEAVAEMEAFSRVMWGLVPLMAGGGADTIWNDYVQGIANGTDPDHEEFWGEPGDYDQRYVEMAVIGFALAVIPERIWTPLGERQRAFLIDWLSRINRHPLHDCNWLFFHVLVNVGFRKLGLPYDGEGMERNLKRIERFALEGGWYADGPGGHSDYYTPFAFHYFGLLYAKLMSEEDPERSGKLKSEAAIFARDFVRWFAADGSALPYGRSLVYRFAQAAFWSAMAYAGVETEDLTLGVIKGILLRNLRWWFKQPIFRPDGVLSVGYAYPNLIMAENYNASGSPYWALKAFLPLALPDDHPFWTVNEEPMPRLSRVTGRSHPSLVLMRQPESDHVAAFNAGHPSTNDHTHASAKYEKFVYSNRFGFSVPRAEWGLSQGAYDSMLALSEGDNLFRVRRKSEEIGIRGTVLFSRWKPWHDVDVRTWLIAGLPWHVRVHRIATGRTLTAAEGGFSLPLEPVSILEKNSNRASAANVFGTSVIAGWHGYREAEHVYPNANTNLLHPRTVIPTMLADLDVGTHWLVSSVCGLPGHGAAIPEPPIAESIERLLKEAAFKETDLSIEADWIRELADCLNGSG